MSKLGKFAAACAAVLCGFGALAASLPEGYQAVEYVDSSGTQWFDTGVVVNENHEFRFKYAILSCKEYRGPFGSYVSESANATRIMVNNGSKTGQLINFMTKASGGSTSFANVTTKEGEVVEGWMNYTRARLNNVEQNLDRSASKIGTADNSTLKLLGRQNYATSIRLYYFQAFETNVLKHSYIPCYEVANPTNIRIYDTCTSAFLQMSGTGTLKKGGDISLGDDLRITGTPDELGSVEPAYGVKRGIAPGDSFPCSAPAVWTNAEETVAATCVGYKVYTNDVIYVEGSSNSFTYEHPDCETGAKLVWQWAFEYKVTASAETGGTVEPAEQWVAEGGQATVTATCDDTHDFRKWDVVPNGSSYANPLLLTVTAPAVATARFQNQGGVERTWKGGATGDWDVPANWEPEGVPDSGDDVVIATKNAAVFATNRIVVKSITLTDATLNIGSSADRTPFTAEISGSLTLNGASKLYVYAKTFSDLSVFANYEQAMAAIWTNASVVEIGGTLAVNGTSIVYPDNDPLTGTPVLFEAQDFVLASGAKVDLHQRGWNSYKYTGSAPANTCVDTAKTRYTYAFSAGWSYQGGGGYGGKGVNYKGKATYGFDYAPFLPGAPNGGHSTAYRGPGSFCGFFSGDVQLDGMIDASGDGDFYSSTTGGGVWLAAKTMTVDQAASISVNGGNITGTYSSTGGGGRISLAFGVDWSTISRLAAGETPTGLSYGNLFGMNATATPGKKSDGTTSSGSGTMTVVADKSVSVPVQITASPVEYENGNLVPNYGFYAYEADAVPTLTAPVGTYPDVYQGFRRLVNNGAVTNDETAIRSVTWKWEGEECLVRLRPCGGGTITANGVDYTTAAEVWFATGTELTLTATPSGAASFVQWVGDLPGMTCEEAMTVVTVDQALTIDALFSDATGVTKEYVGATGGFWHDAANWDPAGIPTIADDVVLNGKAVYCSGVVAVNSLAQTNGTLVIGGKGTTVETQAKVTDYYVPWTGLYVLGDVTIAGGGFSLGARRADYTCFGAVIGGDLTVSGAAKAAFYAPESAQADFASLYANAMKVKIGGAFSVSDTATVYAEVDGLSGAPVKFEVTGDVTITERATVSADARGWHWYTNDPSNPDPRPQRHVQGAYYTLAPGYGISYSIGGVYGIAGTTDSSSRSPAYGYKYAPFLSGSPASSDYSGMSSRAGGQVWIETQGVLALDGKITAVPSTGSSTRSVASGGGIWLCAQKFVAGTTAQLVAKGADGSGNGSYSGGTGGRISVAINVSAEDLAALALGEEPENLTYSDEITSCSANVAGGYNYTDGNKVKYYAPDGTVTTVLGEVDEFNLAQVSTPVAVIAEGLVYETTLVRKGDVWTQTVGATGRDPSSPDSVRWTCESWVISNATEEVASGEGATATFTVGKGPFTVIWHWANRETLAKVVPNDTELGGVSVNGGEATPTADAWTAETGSVTLTAVANDGAEFICWYGDVPFESATNPTLTFDTAVPFGLKPVFRQVAEPTNYVWQVADGRTGNWEDAANWMPTNVPGPADTVTIASGTCVASNYAVCAALNLSGKGALKVGAAASTLLKEAVLVVSGDVTLTNSAALTVNNPNGSYLRHMRMTVGGDLTLTDKATLQLGAGPTNGVDITLATGAGWVTVGGAMTLDGTSKMTAKGDPWTGGTVVFRVGELAVMSNATLSAVGGGYQMVNGLVPICRAPGIGEAHHRGGGYGGRGAEQVSWAGLTYGFALAPIHGGSCMGDYRMGNDYRGGGLIRVHAAGDMTLNGLFDADCNNRTVNNSSGGGVWLTAGNRIRVGETAVFRARGGTGATVGIGGGGRISVCQFISPAQADRMALDGEYHGVGKAAKHVFGRDEFRAAFSLPETAVNLSNGANSEAEPYGGSFTYIDGTPSGLMLIVR